MSPPVLVFARVPGFYAAVERKRHPELAGRPILVGGDPRKRGQLQSASPEALAAGVSEGMSMLEALERCPRARALKTDLRFYREISDELYGQLRDRVDALEPASLGAAFLDASRVETDPGTLARELVERVEAALGLPLQVGVAPVRFLARLAAEESEAGRPRWVRPGEEREFLAGLAVARLPGVGPRATARLAELGVVRVAELWTLSRARVEESLGAHGLRILDYAEGRDPSGVKPLRPSRSLTQEQTLAAPTAEARALDEALRTLATRLAAALGRQGLAASRLALRLRPAAAGADPVSRSLTLEAPLAEAGDLEERGRALLARAWDGAGEVAGLRLTATRLGRRPAAGAQLELFRSSPS